MIRMTDLTSNYLHFSDSNNNKGKKMADTYLRSIRSEEVLQRVAAAAVVVPMTKMMIDSFANCQRFDHRLDNSHSILVRRLLVPLYFPILIYYPVN